MNQRISELDGYDSILTNKATSSSCEAVSRIALQVMSQVDVIFSSPLFGSSTGGAAVVVPVELDCHRLLYAYAEK
jgi:hypothetical protein